MNPIAQHSPNKNAKHLKVFEKGFGEKLFSKSFSPISSEATK